MTSPGGGPGARVDPASGFRFEVRIDGVPVGGFAKCGGLQLETEVTDYPEGGVNTYVHKLPVRMKQSNIRLERGVVDRSLWDWYAEQQEGVFRRRDGVITVLDEAGENPTAEFRFHRAYPVKWTGPELNATQNQAALESLEFVHEGLERRR